MPARIGWDGRLERANAGVKVPVPYHLATSPKWKDAEDRELFPIPRSMGDKGLEPRHPNHNPVLCQLS